MPEDPITPLDKQQLFELNQRVLAAAEFDISKAIDQGELVGNEAPVWPCHLVDHNPKYAKLAPMLEAQLTHLVRQVGLLGVSVSYKTGSLGHKTKGYFQIRAFADGVADEPEPSRIISALNG